MLGLSVCAPKQYLYASTTADHDGIRKQTATTAHYLQVRCTAPPVHAIRDVATIEDLTKHLQGQDSTHKGSAQIEATCMCAG
jgi:hypothetical protein